MNNYYLECQLEDKQFENNELTEEVWTLQDEIDYLKENYNV